MKMLAKKYKAGNSSGGEKIPKFEEDIQVDYAGKDYVPGLGVMGWGIVYISWFSLTLKEW